MRGARGACPDLQLAASPDRAKFIPSTVAMFMCDSSLSSLRGWGVATGLWPMTARGEPRSATPRPLSHGGTVPDSTRQYPSVPDSIRHYPRVPESLRQHPTVSKSIGELYI